MISNIHNPSPRALAEFGTKVKSLSKGTCSHFLSVDLFNKTSVPLLLLSADEYKIYVRGEMPCIRIKNDYFGDHALYIMPNVTKAAQNSGCCCLYFESNYMKAVFGKDVPDILKQLDKSIKTKDIYVTTTVYPEHNKTFFNELKIFNNIRRNFVSLMKTGDAVRGSKNFKHFAAVCGEVVQAYTKPPVISTTSYLMLYEDILRDPVEWPSNSSSYFIPCRLQVDKHEGARVPIQLVSRFVSYSLEVYKPFRAESEASIKATISYADKKCKLTIERYVECQQAKDRTKLLKEHI